MKKISSILFASAAAALALVSCSKEITAPADDANADGITRTVKLVSTGVDTKTAFGTPGGTTVPTLWTANDSNVKVSLNLAAPVDATVHPVNDGANAWFQAEITDDGSGNYVFGALSPASAYSAIDKAAGTVTVAIPASQTPLAGSPDEAAQVLFGKTAEVTDLDADIDIDFSHVTAYGKLTLSGLALDSDENVVNIKLVSDENWVGTWDLNVASGSLTAKSGTKNIILTTSATEDIYFASAPVDLGGKAIKILVWTNKGVYKKVVTVPVGKKFEAGKVASITVDMSAVAMSTVESIFTAAGYDLADYVKKELSFTKGYYNSSGNNYYTQQTSDATANNFAATPIYIKPDFPVGTVIVVNDGYKYRPEAWFCMYQSNPGTKNQGVSGGIDYGTRPGEFTSTAAQVKVVDAAWWARTSTLSFYFRAFNVGVETGTALTENERALVPDALGVFVPKEKATLEGILEANGYDSANYEKLELTWTEGAFYSSTGGVNLTMQAVNNHSFFATNIVNKASLPNGTLIVSKEFITYRPEGWQSDEAANSGSRPAAVTGASVVEVNDAWWADASNDPEKAFNYRAFNVQMTGTNVQFRSGSTAYAGHTTVARQVSDIENAFAVFVPKN
ncbi:MAG: hypothetical protein IJ222_10150 [Bacteroidales bacterium]|nr:hypothetical protein [Bacteroidales bacterium]